MPPVPSGPRIDRAALERIIQRAAELQASERDIGEGLTEGELLQLGADVGIPEGYLRQAMLEEQVRAVVPTERGFLAWLAGPHYVSAMRTIARPAAETERGLHRWLEEGELLAVKRRFPDRTAWEPHRGTIASLKRSFRSGGRLYMLARAREVVAQVAPVDAGRCHVRLLADISNERKERVTGAATLTVFGAASTTLGIVLGVAVPIAGAFVVLGALGGMAVSRARLSSVERTQVALEQVLDRAEHGEFEPSPTQQRSREHPFGRLADEIRKSFGV
ncbi:MAG TPA: hypothetical protein VJ992_01820 [Gemmatimonadales bacterium]|nr:hypothetical protein [Gemmatimonadales bacterium]